MLSIEKLKLEVNPPLLEGWTDEADIDPQNDQVPRDREYSGTPAGPTSKAAGQMLRHADYFELVIPPGLCAQIAEFANNYAAKDSVKVKKSPGKRNVYTKCDANDPDARCRYAPNKPNKGLCL